MDLCFKAVMSPRSPQVKTGQAPGCTGQTAHPMRPQQEGSCAGDSGRRSSSWRFFLTRSLDRKLERKRVASQGLRFLIFFFSFSIKRIFHRIENTVRVTQAHSYLLLSSPFSMTQ